LTSTTASGGKKIRATPAWTTLQPGQALLAKPLPPLADDLSGQIQSSGDLGVLLAFSRQQDDFRPDDVAIRRRILPSCLLQVPLFLVREDHRKWAAPWHRVTPFMSHATAMPQKTQPRYVIVFMKPCTKFEGEVMWNGLPRAVTILQTQGTPLVGMALLEKHRIRIDVIPQGNVTIDSIGNSGADGA
jgi:hypothetical protein